MITGRVLFLLISHHPIMKMVHMPIGAGQKWKWIQSGLSRRRLKTAKERDELRQKVESKQIQNKSSNNKATSSAKAPLTKEEMDKMYAEMKMQQTLTLDDLSKDECKEGKEPCDSNKCQATEPTIFTSQSDRDLSGLGDNPSTSNVSDINIWDGQTHCINRKLVETDFTKLIHISIFYKKFFKYIITILINVFYRLYFPCTNRSLTTQSNFPQMWTISCFLKPLNCVIRYIYIYYSDVFIDYRQVLHRTIPSKTMAIYDVYLRLSKY